MAYLSLRSCRLRQIRGVMSVPKHFALDPVRRGEYKIARVRLSTSLREAKKVVQYYRTEGSLEISELIIYFSRAIHGQSRDHGAWAIAVMKKDFIDAMKSDLRLHNNLIHYYLKIWEPVNALRCYLDIFKAGLKPNNDTYTFLLRVCADAIKRPDTRRETLKPYREIADVIIHDVLPARLHTDGRHHLFQAVRHYYLALGDDPNADKWARLLHSGTGSVQRRFDKVASSVETALFAPLAF